MTRLFIGAGRDAGVRAQDLVGAITGEAGLTGRQVGAIDIADRFSLVEVPEELAEDVIEALARARSRAGKSRSGASVPRSDQPRSGNRHVMTSPTRRPAAHQPDLSAL